MEKVLLKELIKATNGEFIFGHPDAAISSISTDTRTLKRGAYFFPLKGEKYDGHSFLPQAIERGADGIILSKFTDYFERPLTVLPNIVKVNDTLQALGDFAAYYRKKFNVKVIGITGSNGKTTTKEMLRSILNLVAPTVANIRSYNNLVGTPLTLLEINSSHKYSIVELGISLPKEMERLIEISRPEVGIITTIGNAHLEYFKSKENVLKEKKKLLLSLPSDGLAIVNIDDHYLKELPKQLKCRCIGFGFSDDATVTARDVVYYSNKTKFEIIIKDQDKEISDVIFLPTVGKFNIYNALAAASAAYFLGVGINIIKEGLESFSMPEMRMEGIYLKNGAIVINDAYNANPDSMREAINIFMQIYPNKEKILVLGDMLELGEASRDHHISLLKFLISLPIYKVYISGSEIKEAFESIGGSKRFKKKFFVGSKDEIVKDLKKEIGPRNAILIKASRKMAMEEVLELLSS